MQSEWVYHQKILYVYKLGTTAYITMKRGLFALALGGLAAGMAKFTMMGILPDIALAMDKDIPVTANLISFYALGVLIGAPTLVLMTSRYNPKYVLMLFMGLFVVFHGLFSLSSTFGMMEVTRFLAGLPHGAFFGVGSVVAAKMAPPGKEAGYISIMFVGMTIANLLGVPLGTYIGHYFSWRYTYGIIAVIGLLTVLSLWTWLPNLKTNNGAKAFHQLQYVKSSE